MTYRFSAALLASAALWASPASAQDAPAPAPAAALSNDEVAALRAQVQAMQAQLDSMKAGMVKLTPPPADKPSWASSTTISGKGYANISSISQKSDGVDSSQNGTQTELKRFYIGVDHKFNDMFSANLTTDFRYNANGTSKDVLVYVKKAYVQAKFSPALFVRVGAADLPWVPFMEDLYGYRFVENVVIDRTKYGTSSDWGVHLGGSIKDGLVSYAFSAINGAGYKTLARNSNTIDLEGRISVKPIKQIVLGVGGYTGKLGKSAGNLPSSATPHRATRFDAVAAYVGDRVRAGVEYFTAKNWNNVTTTTTDRTNGWSAFASFAVTPQVGVFGRYDWVNPNKRTNAAMKEHYFNFGVDYQPIKAIDIALVYKRDRVDHGFLPTANGTIGGLDKGTYNEVGVFSQFKF